MSTPFSHAIDASSETCIENFTGQIFLNSDGESLSPPGSEYPPDQLPEEYYFFNTLIELRKSEIKLPGGTTASVFYLKIEADEEAKREP